MRLGPSPLTKSNFLHARKMYREGMTLGSVLMWPIRSRIGQPHVFAMRNGVSFISPQDLNFQLLWREVWLDEVYGQGEMNIAPQGTIVDVGANIGLFSIWAATRCEGGRVIAVEPSPRMADFLRKNAARNRKSVTVIQAACGGAQGKGALYTPYGDEARNTLNTLDSSVPARALADVEILTLEELFKRSDIETCDFLKLDCEGSEYDIVLNSPPRVLEKIHQIALEYHPGLKRSHTPEKLQEFLGEHGFMARRQPLETPGYGYIYAIRAS
jgi:FkbM family methyltransferase